MDTLDSAFAKVRKLGEESPDFQRVQREMDRCLDRQRGVIHALREMGVKVYDG